MIDFIILIGLFLIFFIWALSHSPSQALLLIILAFIVFIAVFINQIQTQHELFRIWSLLITCFYAFLITIWYKDSQYDISWFYALIALFGCGLVAVILSVAFFYPFWQDISYKDVYHEVEQGWWIFKNTQIIKETIPTHPIVPLLNHTGMDAGIVEELAKLLAVIFLLKNQIHSKKLALFYTVLCALGFAMIENIYYFLNYGEVLFIRANPAHAVFSAIWGYGLGLWLLNERSFLYFLGTLLLGMTLHALWNLLAVINTIVFIWLFIMVSWHGLIFIKRKLQESEI